MPPYTQGFPFLPPYPPQETNRSIASVPVAESGYTTDKPAAPSYGLITDLPLPVPTTEALLQVCMCSEIYHLSSLHLRPSELVQTFEYKSFSGQMCAEATILAMARAF